jgi:hypothetical protein
VPQTGNAVEGVCPKLVQVWPMLQFTAKTRTNKPTKYFCNSLKGIIEINVYTALETITTVKTLPHSSISANYFKF